MAQHLTTFNKILFAKGDFSDKKMHQIVLVFDWGSAPDPAGGATMLLPPDLLGETPSPFSYSLNAFGVSMCGPVLNTISWQPRR